MADTLTAAAEAALTQGVILQVQHNATNQQEQPVHSQPDTDDTPPATNGWGGGTNPPTAGASTGWGQH